MYVALLTLEQKELLQGRSYGTDLFFNSVQDRDGNWVISREEIENCKLQEYSWIKELPLSEFKHPEPTLH